MAISIKNAEQVKNMRLAGKVVAGTYELIEKAIRPGVTTLELDKIAEEFIKSKGATSNFKGYRGFPGTICTSVNDEVIHGIPCLRKLVSGDIISIDTGAVVNGYHGDAARTYVVDDASDQVLRLIEVTKESFFLGIKYAKEGCHLHEISGAIGDYVEACGYSVVREFVGHGIGKDLHEPPEIPNYRQASRGPKLACGMTIAIEPMVNMGSHEIEILDDDWTIVTADGKFSAHYENTVLITDGEPEILTI